MSLKEKAKNKVKNKIKKVAFKVIKPFLPFIIIIVGLFFAICTIIDAVFIQEVQNDDSSMSTQELEIKKSCIEKASYLNTCNNFIGNVSTNYLLDVNNLEESKEIEWAHLYSLMAFHNMSNNDELDKNLLDKISSHFISTFIYEKSPIITETKTIDEDGNETINTKNEFQYLLVECNTIIGHYKYYYKDQTTDDNNIKITKKIFSYEELIEEKYQRLKEYLKEELHIRNNDLNTNVEIIIQAANGYTNSSETTNWLNSSSTNTITNGSSLIPKGMFIWPIPRLHKSNLSFWYENTSYYSELINYILGTDVGAPVGADFVAMADGTVIKATYSNSYGNMVMINHRK